MGNTVDRDFIRRGIELADLNAVRVALYQHTHDPAIGELPTAINLSAEQRDMLVTAAVDWLEANAGPGMPEEPAPDELRSLMNMATKDDMGDLEFEARRELPAFKPFPCTASWTGEKPSGSS